MLPNLETLGNKAAPSRNNLDSPHWEVPSPQVPVLSTLFTHVVLRMMHRAGEVSSCGPTHETSYLSGGEGREWWWRGGRRSGNCDGLDENVVPRELRNSFVQLWGRVGCLPAVSLSVCFLITLISVRLTLTLNSFKSFWQVSMAVNSSISRVRQIVLRCILWRSTTNCLTW